MQEFMEMKDLDFHAPVTQTPIVYCKDCRYWDADMMQQSTKTQEGLCRRHAPNPIITDETADNGTTWPRTFEDDWCGEGEAAIPETY